MTEQYSCMTNITCGFIKYILKGICANVFSFFFPFSFVSFHQLQALEQISMVPIGLPITYKIHKMGPKRTRFMFTAFTYLFNNFKNDAIAIT